jgi:threonine dehydratase
VSGRRPWPGVTASGWSRTAWTSRPARAQRPSASLVDPQLVGREPVDGVPSFDAVLIALGGGALATGVGHVMKAFAPEVEVICVQPLAAPAMTLSWRERRVVTTDTIADGVAGRRPLSAVLEDRDRLAGRHVVTIVCGSNVDVDSYRRWVGDLGSWR